MRYVALLRGIGPGNPNMRNEKLRMVFEDLGFQNVQTVISSGNVLFESDLDDTIALEEKIEKALPEQLGFTSTTIIRSYEKLKKLAQKNPFKGIGDSKASQQNVTFLKQKPKAGLKFPYQPENRDYKLLGIYDQAVCSIINLTSEKTPDLMVWLEKQYGKEVTTRTWKTVHRILKKMEETK